MKNSIYFGLAALASFGQGAMPTPPAYEGLKPTYTETLETAINGDKLEAQILRFYDTDKDGEWDTGVLTLHCDVASPNQREYKIEVYFHPKLQLFMYDTLGNLREYAEGEGIDALPGLSDRIPVCPDFKEV